MKSAEVRKKYIEFFKKRGHAEIPSAPLVPENDPTTLFTSSGMQPLIPYLLGQPHPSGKRLVDSQKSFRSQDIEEVGDNRHTTFFEMLGNWSLGDYFKKEQLPWIFEFLTKELHLDPKRLYVSVFEGSGSVPKDTESIAIWKELFGKVGIDARVGERIFTYPARKNWWSRSGEPEKMPAGEPGGPDSEIFFDFGKELQLHEKSIWKDEPCHPNCDCGRFMEIANSVFMQYQKQADGTLKELSDKVVDFGGGLERMVAATENTPDIFTTDLFDSLITTIKQQSDKEYEGEKRAAIRVVADHIKAAAFMIVDGVEPSNKDRGYVLRRLIRRSVVKMMQLDIVPLKIVPTLCQNVLQTYADTGYFSGIKQYNLEISIGEEIDEFERTLQRSTRKLQTSEHITGELLFDLKQTDGLPTEIAFELLNEWGCAVDIQEINKTLLDLEKKHRELSRTAAKGMFKGGLADHSEETTKLHTAHHLLLASLQKIVDPAIRQRGSNITAERLRMDFNFARKLSEEEIKKVEELVNQKIKEDLPVVRIEMDRIQAEKIGAQMEFGHKYPDRVSVYFVGPQKDFFSAEFCGGPHVEKTGALGHFKIIKEESAGSGIRRIYAVVTTS